MSHSSHLCWRDASTPVLLFQIFFFFLFKRNSASPHTAVVCATSELSNFQYTNRLSALICPCHPRLMTLHSVPLSNQTRVTLTFSQTLMSATINFAKFIMHWVFFLEIFLVCNLALYNVILRILWFSQWCGIKLWIPLLQNQNSHLYISSIWR